MAPFLELLPEVFQVRTSGGNVFLIAEDELTLIDTGYPGASAPVGELLRHLGRSWQEISYIILTHNHGDHVGGLREFKKRTSARVALHRLDMEGQGMGYPLWLLRLVRSPLVQWLDRVQPYTDGKKFLLARSWEIDLVLDGGEAFRPLGGLRAIHTPGHSLGSICLYAPQKRLLFASDAIYCISGELSVPRKPPTVDIRQAAQSIKKLAEFPCDIICLGHGRPITAGAGQALRKFAQSL